NPLFHPAPEGRAVFVNLTICIECGIVYVGQTAATLRWAHWWEPTLRYRRPAARFLIRTGKDSMTTNGAVPQRLYLFQLSTTDVPLPSGQTLEMSSGCYLIEMSDGKHILIDSGMPPDFPTAGMSPSTNKKNA